MPSRSTLIVGGLLAAGLAGTVMIVYVTVPTPISLPTAVFTSITFPTFTKAPTTMPGANPTQVPTPVPTVPPTPTPTPVPASAPFVSSDGKLAYVEAGRLVVIRQDGSTTSVAEAGAHPVETELLWSPDGRRLLYATGGENDDKGVYHIWDAVTGQGLNLTQEFPHLMAVVQGVTEAGWSPDGARLLLFSSESESPESSLLTFDYWVLDVETHLFWHVVEQGENISATWVNTSTILYTGYQGADAAMLRLLDVNPATTLTDTLDLKVAPGSLYSLSPDRRHLARIEATAELAPKMWVVVLPGHPPLALPAQPTVTAPLASPPLWSPDGRWIAYGADTPDSEDEGRACTVLVDTTGISSTRVIEDLLGQAWSPDSRLLAGPMCQSGGCGLAVADVLSNQNVTIVSGEQGQLWDLAWSPQGTYLAYSLTGIGTESNGLALWDRATGASRPLMQNVEGTSFAHLQWTPDGCRLYFAQRGSPVEGIHAVEAAWGLGPDWAQHWQVAPPAPGSSTDPPGGLSPCPPSPLEGRRLIAFYGTAAGPGLGIVGRYDISTTLELLSEQIQAYRDLDGAAGIDVETIPGLHMVSTIADDFPGGDGDYNHRVSHDVIRPWINAVRAAGGWAILDVQPAHADIATELALIEPLLLEADVHLAIDPEFVMRLTTDVPGTQLGQMTGPQINRTQSWLDRIARATGQRKILIIHQFEDRMIGQKEQILHYPFVDLVWDSDGFGGPGAKVADYRQYRTEPGFEYGGFKIFYRYDTPVMTPEQVFELEPPAAVVIYQ